MFSLKGIVAGAKSIFSHTPKFVLQERLSLAVERAEQAERQVATLQTEKGSLTAQLERARLDYEQANQQLQQFKKLSEDEIRFVSDVEFRRGARTNGMWKPFCPKCHLPLAVEQNDDYAPCSDRKCNWMSNMNPGYIVQQENLLNYGG